MFADWEKQLSGGAVGVGTSTSVITSAPLPARVPHGDVMAELGTLDCCSEATVWRWSRGKPCHSLATRLSDSLSHCLQCHAALHERPPLLRFGRPHLSHHFAFPRLLRFPARSKQARPLGASTHWMPHHFAAMDSALCSPNARKWVLIVPLSKWGREVWQG